MCCPSTACFLHFIIMKQLGCDRLLILIFILINFISTYIILFFNSLSSVFLTVSHLQDRFFITQARLLNRRIARYRTESCSLLDWHKLGSQWSFSKFFNDGVREMPFSSFGCLVGVICQSYWVWSLSMSLKFNSFFGLICGLNEMCFVACFSQESKSWHKCFWNKFDFPFCKNAHIPKECYNHSKQHTLPRYRQEALVVLKFEHLSNVL